MEQKKQQNDKREEFNPMKWIIGIVIGGIVIFAGTLLIGDNGQLAIQLRQQEYVTAEVDSTITVHPLNPISPNIVADSIHIPDFNSLKTKVDSDSLKRYDLYRHEQAVVTIDLEEHKEKVFFTGEDFKAYFDGIVLTFEQIKNKIHDNH